MAPPAWVGPRTVPCHPASAPAELVIVPRREYVSGSPCRIVPNAVSTSPPIPSRRTHSPPNRPLLPPTERSAGAAWRSRAELPVRRVSPFRRAGIRGLCVRRLRAGALQRSLAARHVVLQVSSPGSCPGDCRLPGCCAFAVRLGVTADGPVPGGRTLAVLRAVQEYR